MTHPEVDLATLFLSLHMLVVTVIILYCVLVFICLNKLAILNFLAFSMCLYVFNFLLKARSQPEAQRKQISEHLLKKLMKKLQKYKSNPTASEENFPLYVVLVVRMHR